MPWSARDGSAAASASHAQPMGSGVWPRWYCSSTHCHGDSGSCDEGAAGAAADEEEEEEEEEEEDEVPAGARSFASISCV